MQLQKEQLLTGVLVQNDFKLSLMAPDDLREYAGLTTTVVTCRQKVPMSVAGVGLVRWSLEGMFGAVVNLEDEDDEESEDETKIQQEDEDEDMYGEKSRMTGKTFRVMDCVTVRCMKGYVELEWVGNVLNDGIADAVLAVLMTLESSPAAVKCEHYFHLVFFITGEWFLFAGLGSLTQPQTLHPNLTIITIPRCQWMYPPTHTSLPISV